MPLLAERLCEWDKRREKRRTRGLRPQPSRASAQAPAEVGPKEADIHEDLEKVAEWVDEHGRLPRHLGPDATEAQQEERKEETRLAILLSGQQVWISGSVRRAKPYPDDRRSLLQAVPLLAERLREWDETREKRG